jgi:hypothetical protein
MKKTEEIINKIVEELESANQNYPLFNSYHEGYAVLLEEVDELWDEVKKNPSKQEKWRLKTEAIQVAAMAIKFLQSFDL